MVYLFDLALVDSLANHTASTAECLAPCLLMKLASKYARWERDEAKRSFGVIDCWDRESQKATSILVGIETI